MRLNRDEKVWLGDEHNIDVHSAHDHKKKKITVELESLNFIDNFFLFTSL